VQINLYSIDRFPFLNTVILQSRLAWSIRLRWLAVSGFFLATVISKTLFDLNIPYERIWTVLALLAILNLLYFIILKIFREFTFFAELVVLLMQIIIDLFFLTFLIHFSGGVENPIYLFYIFHIVLSSILFPRFIPFLFATFAVMLFSGLVLFEYLEIIPHYSIFEINIHNNPLTLYLVLIIFTITVYVTEYICTTFMHIYRNSKRIIDKQNRQLLDADKHKTRFFRFASHELKSPLIAIKSSLDSVLKTFSGDMDEKAVNLLTRASLRSDQMLEMVKGLLDLSNHRNLSHDLKQDPIEINEIIKRIIRQEKSFADQRRVQFKLRFHPEKIFIPGREDDFEKLFLNLVDNAIRYSYEKGIVKIESKIEDIFYIFKVEDYGIGIAKNEYNKIFDEFYRSENAKKAVNLGTGLGLSLVKQIVVNYHGTIAVNSEEGKGTTFRISLPLEAKSMKSIQE
jgi:signal transduction histidine kinase